MSSQPRSRYAHSFRCGMAAVLAVNLLVGCGGGDSAPPAPPSQTTIQPTPTQPASTQPTPIQPDPLQPTLTPPAPTPSTPIDPSPIPTPPTTPAPAPLPPTTAPSGPNGSPPAAGAIPPSRQVANVCTPVGEKQYIRSLLNENYLWYNEIPAVDPVASATVNDYFYRLLVQPKDRFSFIIPSTLADSLSTGANIGYGLEWKDDAAGRKRVALVNAGSPAAQAGLARGGVLESVVSTNVNSWYPNQAGAWVTFRYRDTPTAPVREITLNAAAVQDDPLPRAVTLAGPAGRRVGYMLFTDHSSAAQDKLIDAVTTLRSGGLDDLVLDLRYNGGGYLYVAQSLASMVVGARASGRLFGRLQFNNKRAKDSASSAMPFTTHVLYSQQGRHAAGEALPMLGLPRVYVLATSATCSASESIVNALRGLDVEVILIGQPTCGKPYGFSRADNCGKSIYAIEFQVVNAKGFGDYASGFKPQCTVPDDFDRTLGDPAERLLATALHHMQYGNCPATAQEAPRAVAPAPASGVPMQDRPRGGLVLSP